VFPWQTLEVRWAALHNLIETDRHSDGPGAYLVEALEALVDEWHGVAAQELVAEITRSDRLRQTVGMCLFDDRTPRATVEAVYRAAGIDPATEDA
jgi:hypothetical protein